VTVAVLVPAAGSGTRLGPGAPKALRELAGEPLLVHAVRGLRAAPSVGLVVVAAPPGAVAEVAALLASYDDVEVVAGGAERQDSVALALAALPDAVDVVLVHDAARCLTPADVVERVVAAVRGGAPAVVPVLAITDTVKEVAHGRILRTLDRGRLVAVQTPQGFTREVLEEAHRGATGEPATDDAGLVEVLGRSVATVAGDELAFKITRPVDLLLAEALLQQRAGLA
jgi:2-C-methyl-D-erythritol 4-phosphate cytidylyltransferase